METHASILAWRIHEGGAWLTEDELVGWHHQLDGHELERAPRVGDGQENLALEEEIRE